MKNSYVRAEWKGYRRIKLVLHSGTYSDCCETLHVTAEEMKQGNGCKSMRETVLQLLS
jgi:hypothetical protein